MGKLDRDEIHARFGKAVDMAPVEPADWLESEQSRAVGQKKKKDGGPCFGTPDRRDSAHAQGGIER